ncbi:transcription factor RFX3-like [Bacillus rossius redtenbacheri]|uniref:transcription factor RFX3-like n=1 Tax=Bacillus rossius redtenbacheri TaxID=93214 RepID=UPI002FDCB4DB
MKSLQDLAASFETWLANSLRNCPAGLARAKMAAGGALARALRRHLALARVAEAAGALLRDPSRVTQMLLDARCVDLSQVQHQACWVTRCEEETLACLVEGLKGCLREGRQLEGLAAWLKDAAQQALQPYEGKPAYVGAARKFLLRWTYCSSLVMREVTLASVGSFGSLYLLRLLLDGYLYHLVEQRVARELRQIPLLVAAQKLVGGQDPATEPDLPMFAE